MASKSFSNYAPRKRRSEERTETRLLAYVEDASRCIRVQCIVQDISSGGLRVFSKAGLRRYPGLTVQIPECEFSSPVQVRWANGPSLGLSFEDAAPSVMKDPAGRAG